MVTVEIIKFHPFKFGEMQETAMSNCWYEVLSVVHLMATVSLSRANLLLLPKTSTDGYQPKVSEGNFC